MIGFWHNCLCPELLYQTIKLKQEESQHKLLSPSSTTDVKELPSSKSKKSSIQFLSSVPVSHSVAVPSPCRDSAKAVQPCSFVSTRVSQSRKANQKTKKTTKTASWKKIKIVCVCVENSKQYLEDNIECSGCSLWFHFECEGIKEENNPKGKWLCRKCK